MKKFLLPLLVLLTTSFTATSQPTGPRPSPTPLATSAPATYCLPAAQMRVVDTSLRQFEALKPIVVKLRDTNRELRSTNVELRVALTHADTARAVLGRTVIYQEKLTANAEANWRKYQAKSTARGWTIAGLLLTLLGGTVAALH